MYHFYYRPLITGYHNVTGSHGSCNIYQYLFIESLLYRYFITNNNKIIFERPFSKFHRLFSAKMFLGIVHCTSFCWTFCTCFNLFCFFSKFCLALQTTLPIFINFCIVWLLSTVNILAIFSTWKKVI
jgi:hypothetical protein